MMGKVLSVVSRPFRNYNVGNRAAKRIAQEKPKPAPRHPSTIKYLKDTVDLPSSKDSAKIPEEYLSRLKQVYVKSEGPSASDSETDASKRKLPKTRGAYSDPEYGFFEPEVIPTGKISMRQAIELLIRHQDDPDKWTAQMVAKEYKLDLVLTQQMLLYFRAYEMWMPPKKAGSKRPQDSVKKFIIPPKDDPLPRIK
uniref:NADH dehydrogenase [ubiquinone] 1 alpha subcomplex assembly factor 4 n=1 Tax=Strigamia maritima TaxID=126957 RepID=T1IZL8_STRMM